MDSSIGYALMYGCKVSIFNQINKYDRSNIVNSGWDKRHIERFEYFDFMNIYMVNILNYLYQ